MTNQELIIKSSLRVFIKQNVRAKFIDKQEENAAFYFHHFSLEGVPFKIEKDKLFFKTDNQKIYFVYINRIEKIELTKNNLEIYAILFDENNALKEWRILTEVL